MFPHRLVGRRAEGGEREGWRRPFPSSPLSFPHTILAPGGGGAALLPPPAPPLATQRRAATRARTCAGGVMVVVCGGGEYMVGSHRVVWCGIGSLGCTPRHKARAPGGLG